MHNIFGERFVSHRVPAWHDLGLVLEDGVGAMEALRRINGDFVVTMQPVFTRSPDGSEIAIPDFRCALRHPTDDDNEYVPFNVVGDSYQPITMADVCVVFDEFVARDIETLGILGRGEQGFVTVKLPEIDVNGDEVEMYLGATYAFSSAASVEVWPLRVVCQNTLKAAQARARVAYRIVHDASARQRMGEWLAHAYEEADEKSRMLKEVFTTLANYDASAAQARRVVTAAWPEPNRPRENAPRDVMEKREAIFDWRRTRVLKFRDTAIDFWRGGGTGMDTRAAKGTLWGVVNAVAEVEGYRRGSFRGDEAKNVAESELFGKRGDVKERSVDAALAIASRG
jgi:phage/plasmid-like protein (TIGR03299 family)